MSRVIPFSISTFGKAFLLLLSSCNLDESWNDEVEMSQGQEKFLLPDFCSLVSTQSCDSLKKKHERILMENFHSIRLFSCFNAKGKSGKDNFSRLFHYKIWFSLFFHCYLYSQHSTRVPTTVVIEFRTSRTFLFAVLSPELVSFLLFERRWW